MGAGIVHDHMAAFEDGGVHAFDCSGRLFDCIKLDVAESENAGLMGLVRVVGE
jgi:hypothetical protein